MSNDSLEQIKADFELPGQEIYERIDALPLPLWLEAHVFICQRRMDRYSEPDSTYDVVPYKIAEYQKRAYERVLERLRIDGANDESAAGQSAMSCPVCKKQTSEHLGKHLCSNLDCEQYGCDVSSGPVPLKEQLKAEYRATLKPTVAMPPSESPVMETPDKVAEPVVDSGEGWRLLEIGEKIDRGDQYLDPRYGWSASERACDEYNPIGMHYPHRRRITTEPEREATYRAFASAEEFKPHRDRWIRNIINNGAFKIDAYDHQGVVYGETKRDYKHMLETFVFDDDGTPCGVRKSEAK